VAPLLDKTIEGFGELFRVLSFETIGTSSLQSRCRASWMRFKPPGTA
jgi:molybdenum cofactor biosynthesis protein B